MGVVHHSNYLRYLEVARLEWLTQLGISYNTMEEEGVMMPVISAHIDYKLPAKFEDALVVHIHLRAVPLVKMIFDYEISYLYVYYIHVYSLFLDHKFYNNIFF